MIFEIYFKNSVKCEIFTKYKAVEILIKGAFLTRVPPGTRPMSHIKNK